MRNFLSKNIWIVLILLVGLFLRIYKAQELFLYSHDQDLIGWFIKDVVVNHHLRLIGQETSTQGIFIGPLFYYLLTPFYLLFGMDPIGGVVLVTLLGLLSIWSNYFVFSRIFDHKVGLLASLFYAVSLYTVFNDREVVPTMPVILWSVWFLWSLHLLIIGRQKLGFPLLGLLLGLTWDINVTLVLLTPLIVVALFLSKKKLEIRSALFGILLIILISLPFIIFEVRHQFIQINSLFNAFTKDQYDIVSGQEKLLRTILLFSRNITGLLWGDSINISYNWSVLVFILASVTLIYKKIISYKYILIFTFWILIYLVFFSLYSKRLSEYYLNGLVVILIGIFSLTISWLLKRKRFRVIAICVIVGFILINLIRIYNYPVNRSGYVERKALVMEIYKDASSWEYPCVSISYITEPGYNLGYRYLFWKQGVKLKPISLEVPVYTVVFPLRPIFKTDKDFGAIGLIYPNHGSYNLPTVIESCKGDDFNLADSMFGFTQ